MLLYAMTGHENWKNHSCKLHLFVSPTDGLKECHIGDAVRDPVRENIRKHSGETVDARPGWREDCGKWTNATYDVPEGTILKVFHNRSSGGFSMGVGTLMANQFILMREEAALRRLIVNLSQEPTARFSAAYIQGRFDLISFDEATARGAKTMPQFKKFSDPVMVDRAFTVQDREPELRAPAVLTRVRTRNATGKVVEVVSVARRTRKML